MESNKKRIDFEQMRRDEPKTVDRLQLLGDSIREATRVDKFLNEDFVDGVCFAVFVIKKLHLMGAPITSDFLLDFGLAMELLLDNKKEDFSSLETIPDALLFHAQSFFSQGEKDECEFK